MDESLVTETPDATQHLRILIANERAARLEILSRVVVHMGQTVIARELDVEEVGHLTRQERPDVALVGLGESPEHALEHIGRIVDEATCPVIASIDIVLRRFADYHNLEGAFGRRAVSERAKGILMVSHALSDQDSFLLLRRHSQTTGLKVFDIAEAILDSYLLLSPRRDEATVGAASSSE